MGEEDAPNNMELFMWRKLGDKGEAGWWISNDLVMDDQTVKVSFGKFCQNEPWWPARLHLPYYARLVNWEVTICDGVTWSGKKMADTSIDMLAMQDQLQEQFLETQKLAIMDEATDDGGDDGGEASSSWQKDKKSDWSQSGWEEPAAGWDEPAWKRAKQGSNRGGWSVRSEEVAAAILVGDVDAANTMVQGWIAKYSDWGRLVETRVSKMKRGH